MSEPNYYFTVYNQFLYKDLIRGNALLLAKFVSMFYSGMLCIFVRK